MNITIREVNKDTSNQARGVLKTKGFNFQKMNKIILEKAYRDIFNNDFDYLREEYLKIMEG